MTGRDPRVDPRRGDIIRDWGRTPGSITIRKFSPLSGGLVWFDSDKTVYRRESLGFFRRMAATAIVVRAAQDGGEQ